jgi:hypothetical protein
MRFHLSHFGSLDEQRWAGQNMDNHLCVLNIYSRTK